MTTDAEARLPRPVPARPDASSRPAEPGAASRAAAGSHFEAYRSDIDGLRAIAVLAVVVFHAFPGVLPGGFVGVDVFFVISGYLITGVIERRLAAGRFTFSDFYARRIKRILPALVVVLVACYAVGWFALLSEAYGQLGKHIAAGMAFVSNFALWTEAGYFDASATSKPLLHLWSLGIEEQFYLAWPLALWWVARRRGSGVRLVALVGLVSFAINIATVHKWPVAAFYSPLSRFWELQLGCLLALLTRHWDPNRNPLPRRTANALSVAGALALGLSIALFNPMHKYPGWWAILPTGGTFLLIASGPEGAFSRHVLSRRALVGVGLVSYPLYLWHWPLLSFAWIAMNGTPPLSIRAAAVLASGVLAVATYHLVEKPIRFGRARPLKIPALVACSLVIGLVGYATFRLGGLPTRFPPEVRAFANFDYEYKTDARYPYCWLSSTHPFDAFAPFCTVASTGNEHVVLWGDSHAARLYPGLKATLGYHVALSQYTRDACPPVLGVAYPICQQSNAWVMAEIARMHPQVVVLYAVWSHYPTDWSVPGPFRTALLATIDALQTAGVGKIVVVGPAPMWTGGLPKLVYDAWLHDPFHVIPDRMKSGLDPRVATADRQMRSDLASRHVVYFSLTDLLCTDAGCLTHVPDQPTHLVTWDYGHLTTDGAILVAQKLAADRVLP